MDEHYNIEDAAAQLREISDKRLKKHQEKVTKDGVPEMYVVDATLDKYVLTEDYPGPGKKRQSLWRLITKKGSVDPTESNEAQLRIIGVLCGKELPPVETDLSSGKGLRARKHIHQHIKLTGFNNTQFEKAVEKIEAIYVKMSGRFNENIVEPFQPSTHEAFSAIEAHSRYFTSLEDASASEGLNFYTLVDPDGSLQRAIGHEYVHTKDNKVQYVSRVRNAHGGYSYEEVDPVVFKIGDIVEATVAFTLVPISANRKRMVLGLRALALINQDERDRAILRRLKSKRIQTQFARDIGVRSMKRKAAYTTEEASDEDSSEENGEPEMQRMRIDGLCGSSDN